MKLKVHLIERGTVGESHFHFHSKRERHALMKTKKNDHMVVNNKLSNVSS